MTGGAGFIGSHVVDALVARGDEVVVVDDLDPAAHDGKPAGLSSGAEYAWRDVRDPATWRDLLGGVDAVSHQAAKVGLGVDFADVGEYVSRNDAGMACLLHALHDRRFRGRVVLASSMVVYGEGRFRCSSHGVVRPGPRRVDDLEAGRYEPPCPTCAGPLTPEPVPEDHWLDPRNVYAVTKLSQELLGAAYAREHPGVTITSLRYHNVYGPRMPRDTPYAGVASIFRSAYAAGRRPLVFEDGGQRRDFVHVADVARANVLALTNDEPRRDRSTSAAAHPGRSSTWPTPCGHRTARLRRSSAATGSVTSATCSPTRSGQPMCSGSAPPSGSIAACMNSRLPRCGRQTVIVLPEWCRVTTSTPRRPGARSRRPPARRPTPPNAAGSAQ